jgi:hypothetical protein
MQKSKYSPRNSPKSRQVWLVLSRLHPLDKLNDYNEFVHKFESLFAFVQELILEILHGNTRVQCIQHATLIINTIELTKFQRWLLVLACLLTLIPIEQHVVVMHHVVIMLYG